MKIRNLLIATCLVTASQSAMALGPDDFFVPDMTDAKFAASLNAGVTPANGLPLAQGFWTDMVNSGDVPQDGSGVYVAVLDTGMLPQWPFFFSEANIADEYGKGFSHDIYCDGTDLVIGPLKDDRGFITDLASGHGTHVSSTVAGFNVNNAFWVEGVAPAATIIPVLVLDAWLVAGPCVGGGPVGISGGTDAMIAAGIMYVADLKENELAGAPVVINMSLGGPTPSAEIEAAVDYAIEKGVIVVASAGNSGSVGMGYPGGLEQIISAGAAGWASMFLFGWTADVPERTNQGDILGNNWQFYLEDFSSRPNKDLDQKHQDLDVSAPGAWVVGPYKSAFLNNSGYYYLSGTSMAAPHVSGMAALLMGDYPDITQSEMEFLMSIGAAGNPLPASDAIVAFPFNADGFYTANWDGGDYGSGFLKADKLMKAVE
jgi:subtilisin family serine protease